MSKYVNITVSTSLSTDFILEVNDDASKEEIELLAKQQVQLPNEYPKIIDKILQTRMGIKVNGIDSMLRDWNVDEITYIIDDETN